MTHDNVKMTTVVVRQPFKVTHAGISYWPGQLAEVPDRIAAEWVKLGFVGPVSEATDEPEQVDVNTDPEPDQAEAKPRRRR